MAGDGDGNGVLPGRIGDAGGSERDAGSGGENGGRGVISVGVDGTTVVWAGRAGKAPANRGIRIAAAGDGGAERLQRAEFDGRGKGRERDGDIAGDGDAGGGGFGGIGVTGGGDLYFPPGGRSAGAVKSPSGEMAPT